MPSPKNAIVVLLDSLNRHMLAPYGGDEFESPNLTRMANRSVRFDNHHTGALPCMPARHDLLCGALDFLWRPWGSIEIWEDAITVPLRQNGVTTMLCSDHPHLFETGGENYHTEFHGWEYLRGHEGDPWKTAPDPSWVGAPSFNRGRMPYDNSRGYFRGEEDFPGPKTMRTASEWVDSNAGKHDRFLLFIDEFDPHEPFDTPEPYASMYDPGWEGPHLIWPPYMRGAVEKGVLSEDDARQVRANYGAKLTMIDTWFGKLLDSIDRNNLWDDTVVIVCTDHGHYLGEKDIWGKPNVPIYETLGHTPLFVAWPGIAPSSVGALTTNVDIHATLLDLFGISVEHRTHGESLMPLISGEATSIRDWALTGVWGREVCFRDGTHNYARAPEAANEPLSMWSNRWSTMPIASAGGVYRMPRPDDRAYLDKMPGSVVPVIRQPFNAQDPIPFWGRGQFTGNHLFATAEDPGEDNNLVGTALEKEIADHLREALRSVDAPDDQFVRLGLS